MNEHKPTQPLSPEGRARCESILIASQRRVRARGRRRRAVLTAASAAPVLALALIMIWPARQRAPIAPPPARTTEIVRAEPAAPAFTNVAFDVVQTRTDLQATRVSDTELLELLHQAGHTDTGLARLPGRVVLTGAPLTRQDPPPSPEDAPAPGA